MEFEESSFQLNFFVLSEAAFQPRLISIFPLNKGVSEKFPTKRNPAS
jgi:hypothetical protein